MSENKHDQNTPQAFGSDCQPVKSRILVIDDNRAIHDDIKKILIDKKVDHELERLEAELFGDSEKKPESEYHHYEVHCAQQGQEGLELLIHGIDTGQAFDMAIVDMRMPPGWDGVETIEQLWSRDPNLPIVICTAYSDHTFDDISERLNHSDNFLILKKPFDTAEISQVAAALSGRRKSLKQLSDRMGQLESKVDQQSHELEVAHADAEQLLQSISSLLVSIDYKGCVRRWNPVAERLFELAKDEVFGKPFANLNIQWKQETCLDEINQLLQKKSASKTQVEVLDSQGETRRLGVTIYPIDSESQSHECLILGSDITEQVRMEAQLQQAQRLEAVGQLAAGVAHEINTPIQYIGDNVRYLEKCFDRLAPLLDLLPSLSEQIAAPRSNPELANRLKTQMERAKLNSIRSQIPDAIKDSCEGIEAIASIVSAMKEFSHPGSDKPTKVDLNHVLSSAITVAKNEWKSIAEVHTDFDMKQPEIMGLPIELNQAFLNIIVNACHAVADSIKASDENEKGSITVTTRDLDELVEIRVADTGGGIPKKIRHRIFAPFFTTKEVGKGTGQGLAIAHGVFVSKHNGRIWCEVEDDVGSTFVIQLPKSHPSDDHKELTDSATG